MFDANQWGCVIKAFPGIGGAQDMPWWGWITIGAMLLLAEMTIVDLEFYLLFLGISALLTGAVVLSGFALPYWVQWILFAALAAGSLILFRRAVYAKLRPPAEGEVPEGVDGARAVADEAIAPGAQGSVMLRGSTWTARNVGNAAIESGAACEVVRSQGLVLDVR